MAFTCPDCLWTSHNRNDEMNSYCGHCHAYMDANFMPSEFESLLIKAILSPPTLAPERILRALSSVPIWTERAVSQVRRSLARMRNAEAITPGERGLVAYAGLIVDQLSSFGPP
jgi:hypothetical protein